MIPLFAFLSGFSALLYQILWAREFAVVLGSTTHAISTVLAAFMAGLGLGGFLIGRFIDRSERRPLRIYAIIEFGIAAAAVIVEMVIRSSPSLYSAIYNVGLPTGLFYAVRFLVTFIILCVPTFFMGGTLPALIPDRRTAGWIYGANTLGAAVGALAAGFFFIQRFGLPRTLAVAAGVNVSIAAASWLIAAKRGAVMSRSRTPGLDETHSNANIGLVVYSISGFVALGLEVAWSRTLVFSIGSTTYALSAMLVVVLCGLAIGSSLVNRIVARRPMASIALGQWLIAVLTVSTIWILTHVFQPWRDWLSYSDSLPWSHRVWIEFAQTAVLLLPSSILFGAIFPLSAQVYLHGQKVHARVGRLLGANTFAAIGGALLTGFVFIPVFGIYSTYVILGSVSLIGSSTAALCHEARRYAPGSANRRHSVQNPERSGGLRDATSAMAHSRAPLVYGVAALLTFVLLARVLSGQASLEPVSPTEKLLFYSEGTNGTVSVLEDAAGDRNLLIDHIAVAGTDPVFMTDQKSLAHLPMLIHPNPKRVLTVGFGSGGASYSFTTYPQLDSIRAVEIDPAVFDAAPYFKASNGDPFTDPRFSIIRDDARSYLLYTHDRFDIITTDCTDLRYKSNALLYTKEFFETARRRLNPNGMVVAWVPLGGLSTGDLKITLRTFSASFPNASAWYMDNYPTHYLLLVGTESPLHFDVDEIRRRLEVPAVKRDLASIGLDDAVKLLSCLFKDRDRLNAFTEGAEINSDEKPVLEFSVPKAAHAFSLSTNLEQFAQDVVIPPDVPDDVLRARPLIVAGHIEYNKPGSHYQAAARFYGKAQEINPADSSLAMLMQATARTATARRRELESRAKVESSNFESFNELGLVREDAGDLDGALSAFQRAVALAPSVAALHLNIGRIYDLKGMPKDSIAAYETALRIDPDYSDAWNNIGVVYLEANDYDKALAAFEKLIMRTPQSSTAWMNLGLAAFRSDRPQRAREAFDRSLQLNPRGAEAYLNRAILRLSGNDVEGAKSDLQSALREQPENAEAHYNLGIVQEQLRNGAEAAAEYMRAIELNPRHALAYNNLGILYSDRGESRRAIESYLRGIAVDPKNSGLRNNLAMEYVKLGNLTEAITQYQEAIALQPNMFEPYANLGMIYRRRNQTAEAERYLAEARKRNPNLRIP